MKKIVALCTVLTFCLSSLSFAKTHEPVKQTIRVVNNQFINQSVGANIWVDGGSYISESKTELSPTNLLSKLVSKSTNIFTIQTDDPRKTNRSDWFGNVHVRLYASTSSQDGCYQEASVNIPAKIDNNKIVLQSKAGGYSINADQMTYSNDHCNVSSMITKFIVTVNGNQDAGYEIEAFGLIGR